MSLGACMGPQGDDQFCPCVMKWSDEKKAEFVATLDFYETEPELTTMKQLQIDYYKNFKGELVPQSITIPLKEAGDGIVEVRMTHEFLQYMVALLNSTEVVISGIFAEIS